MSTREITLSIVVFLDPRGHAFGACTIQPGRAYLADIHDAWEEMFPDADDERQARRNGVAAVEMSHAEYMKSWSGCLSELCEHSGGAA